MYWFMVFVKVYLGVFILCCCMQFTSFLVIDNLYSCFLKARLSVYRLLSFYIIIYGTNDVSSVFFIRWLYTPERPYQTLYLSDYDSL